MSFLQLVLSLDKTKDGLNSILPIVSFWPVSQQMFQIFMFESVLKISEHVEICNACWKHIKKQFGKL